MAIVTHLYLTHPQVRIEQHVPVPFWGLSDQGQARTAALATFGWIRRFRRLVSSEEVKACETSEILAKPLRVPVEVRPDLHENDRSSTGYLPGPEFEATADAFFASPDVSIRGWETARVAQARIVRSVRAITAEEPHVPTLFVGHGAVGTLLKCALAGRAISRQEDQPAGGGNHFGFSLGPDALTHDWLPMEDSPPG
jgi:broad specificity phosphatase PhoE